MDDVVVVIPARFGSSRFPGKVLYPILGRPMVWWVWEASRRAGFARDQVIIATDSDEVRDTAQSFGAKVVMTSPDCASGSDRCAEAVQDLDCRWIINLQADEPAVKPELISNFAEFLKNSCVSMVSIYTDLRGRSDDPNVVKVILDKEGFAIYFSRSPIPYPRYPDRVRYYQHIGIYGYARDFLLEFVSWPKGYLESVEGLEQLRAVERGVKIKMFYSDCEMHGVDVLEDVKVVESLMGGGDA